jgi:hypothetical protein
MTLAAEWSIETRGFFNEFVGLLLLPYLVTIVSPPPWAAVQLEGYLFMIFSAPIILDFDFWTVDIYVFGSCGSPPINLKSCQFVQPFQARFCLLVLARPAGRKVIRAKQRICRHCRRCRRTRVVPVTPADSDDGTSATRAPARQRQRPPLLNYVRVI